MGRYIGPTCRKMRRVGYDLYLKSSFGKSLKEKCVLNVVPGQHGMRKKKYSDYSMRLYAKQAVKFMYGVLERQFKNYFKKAYNMSGFTGFNILLFLERRLDNVVFRMGFASTRAEARQLVKHRCICLKANNMDDFKVVDIPSYSINVFDKICIGKIAQQNRILKLVKNYSEFKNVPWVEVDMKRFEGTFLRLPLREELFSFIDERLIVEFYSK